ncbi:DUF6193 family natural product biosynthesis protein [Micromonospora sp. AB353]|uniref:DUF6193 family natural product biosynthesis protein n=1 Tax=Micromonospora sp. AB353 TaxID=3413282 RepID=UPI003C24714E
MEPVTSADDVWRALMEDTQGWWVDDPVFRAAYEHPTLRALFPMATHGTIKFFWTAWSEPDTPAHDLPLIACGGPPYQVIAAGYERIIGLAATAEEAAELVVENLPPAPVIPGSTCEMPSGGDQR